MVKMNEYRFKKFDDDVKILGIGSLFRRHSGGKWYVNLQLAPSQRSSSYLSLSNAPILARRRVINPTTEFSKPGYRQRIKITDTRKWLVKRIGDCPITGFERKLEAGQFCFVFENYDGRTIFLPQFELARTLFFHGTYLSKTAIESDCLRSEFDVFVDHTQDCATIRVMPSADCTVSHLNEPKSQKHLSWVLLDADARRSYESICKFQRLHGVNAPRYRKWTFQFEPPPLENVFLQAHGVFDKEVNCFFAWEIDAIRGVPNAMPGEIYIEYQELEHSVPGSGQVVHPAGNGEVSPLVIHDDIAANANTTAIQMEADSVAVVFKKPFHVIRVASRDRNRPTTTQGDESGNKVISVSTEEGVADHGLPAADWNTLNDETDYSQFFENKFACFLNMVRVLVGTYGCAPVAKSIVPLPKVGRCKKHLLSTTGEARSIAEVGLRVGGKIVHLLEIDTSDADKAISTQVLVVRNLRQWKADFEILRRELIQDSLNWPTRFLDNLCGKERHRGVNHPQAPKGDRGVLDPTSTAGWAARIFGWMQKL
jgi:hypothetical protein